MVITSSLEIEKPGENCCISRPVQVAVVIPARDRSDLLEQCLKSIAAQELEKAELEVIVCDDGSVENLGPAVGKFREEIPKIQLLRQVEPKGPAAARNMGFRSSKASNFVCVDSDVICHKDFLKQMIEALKENPDWVAVEATVLPENKRDSILSDAPENQGGRFPSGASAYRSEALRRVGGFDEEFLLPACEDAELAARLLQVGKYGYVAGAVVYHPVRRISLRTHWQWRKHWRYEMILAKRYGFLSFPGKSAGPFPRLRLAMAALITLPAGRLLEGIRYIRRRPADGMWACLYAIFDVFCGLWAIPTILFSRVPPQRDYLSKFGGR